MTKDRQVVGDLPEFPFATFEEFRDAQREGRARVWVRYDFKSVWAFSSASERVGQIALTGSALSAALVFTVLAILTKDRWWLCGVPAALLGLLFAAPSPGLISGGGCIMVPIFAAGVIASPLLFWVVIGRS